jgi:dihydropyrimidine dehydrogenase (NAD+) subunit PreA
MKTLTEGVDPRTGNAISSESANWTTHPNNPLRERKQ